MNSPFVRPQDTSHNNGNFVTATKAGGLYGMDVEGDSEHTDPEPTELGDIGRLDADVPIEMPSAEAHNVRVKSSPERPTPEEVERHDATHCPYRSWCTVCVAASAKEDPHPSKGRKDTEMGLLVIDFDCDLLEEKLTVLIVRDAQSGAKLSYDCEVKGPGDDWVVKQLARDFEVWRRTDIFLKSDGEPATIALQQALAEARPGCKTMMRNSPPYDFQSN